MPKEVEKSTLIAATMEGNFEHRRDPINLLILREHPSNVYSVNYTVEIQQDAVNERDVF